MLHICGSAGTLEASQYIFQSLSDHQSKQHSDRILLYFSFDKYDDQRNSLASMFNSLISQIISNKEITTAAARLSFRSLYSHRGWTELELWTMFRDLVTVLDQKGVVCVINGLDSCGDSGVAFLVALNQLPSVTERHMKFAIASAIDSGLDTALTDWPSINIDDRSSDPNTAPELASYIDLELLDLMQLSPGCGRFETVIRDSLAKCGHDRDWRRLVLRGFRRIEALLTLSSEEFELLKPVSTTSTFTRILNEVPLHRQNFARRVLTWTIYAFRPLTVWELGTAISNNAEDLTLSPGESSCQQLIHDIDDVFGGMLVIKNNQVCFGHPEAREFLVATDREHGDAWYNTDAARAHGEITNACFAFLSSTQVRSAHPNPANETLSSIYSYRYGLCNYAIQFWPRHYDRIPARYLPTAPAIEFVQNTEAVRWWTEAYWWRSNSVTRRERSFVSLLPVFAELGLQDLVKHCLAVDGEKPESSQDCALALIEAARYAQVEVIRLLLPLHGYDPPALQDALLAAASSCNEAVLDDLINYTAKNVENFTWPSDLLCRAAWFGFDNIVRKLLESGASYDDAVTSYGLTPLILAVREGHLGVVKTLLEYKASCTKVTAANKRLPLHFAASKGFASISKLLLDAGADINALDSSGFSAIHLAATWGCYESVNILLKEGANTQRDGPSPLTVAARKSYLKCTKLLLEDKTDTEFQTRRNTALRDAAFNKHLELCQTLLDAGADVNTIDDISGLPIICINAKRGNMEVVKLLVENGADPNTSTSVGWTALHYACQRGDASAVTYLLRQGAEVNRVTTNYGETPLIVALRNKRPDTVELLLNSGADINLADTAGWIPILISQIMAELTAILLKHGADPNQVVVEYTPLYQAAANNRFEAVELLLPFATPAILEFEWTSERRRYTALAAAVYGGHNKVARLLIEAGANINCRCGNDNNFLLQYPMFTFSAANVDTLRTLLEFRPALDLKDNYGDTALHCITESTPLESTKLLVHAGLDLESRNIYSDTPLCRAVRNNNLEVAKFLISKKANLNVTGAMHGPPLQIACRSSTLEFVKMLVEAGADVNFIESLGPGTPLASACIRYGEADEEIVRYLLDQPNTDVTVRGGLYGCALNAACGSNLVIPDILKLLLDRGAHIDVPDPFGRVAIHFAASQAIEHFQPIHDAGGDVELADKMGRTALHWAVIGCHIDVVDRVISLSRGVVDQPDVDGWTPLLWAARGTGGHNQPSPRQVEAVIKLLLERGADPYVRGAGHDREWSPVKVARYHGRDASIIKLLTPKAKAKPAIEGEKEWDEEFHKSRKAKVGSGYCDCCETVSPPAHYVPTQLLIYIYRPCTVPAITVRLA